MTDTDAPTDVIADVVSGRNDMRKIAKLEAELERIKGIKGLWCEHHQMIDGCGICKVGGSLEILKQKVARAQGSLCSMRDGFIGSGNYSYANRVQYVIELLMGSRCPKGGSHVPTMKLSATICEKCNVVLASTPSMEIPVKVKE